MFVEVPVVETIQEEEDNVELPSEVNINAPAVAEDTLLLGSQGFDVDDDTEPAPENIPQHNGTEDDALSQQTWGWNGLCPRRMSRAEDHPPKLVGLSDTEASTQTIYSLFLMLFPLEYLKNVLIGELNKNLERQSEHPCCFGEFLRFLGIWFYMATFKGFTRDQFWSSESVDEFNGAPVRFHPWMSTQRFDTILRNLDYTDRPTPAYKDKFHGIRQLIEAWNENMKAKFLPSWVSCLDASMCPWTHRWTCPGWMFVPRMRKPFGNEYYSLCCGLSTIMWCIELVEGKDAPPDREADPASRGFSKTVGLML
jgi:hypothetical protein